MSINSLNQSRAGERVLKSITYGQVTVRELAKFIMEKTANTVGEYNLIIGTDSQNFSDTKVVLVAALQHIGKGGVFFYEVSRVKRISDIRQKLWTETQMSREFTDELLAELENLFDDTEYVYSDHLTVSIHVDAGENGPTRAVIPEIVAYIKSCYNGDITAVTKPDSFVASSIADRYSK